MRKILLALVVAFTTAVCSAASYDEEQLLGYWEVTQQDGQVSPGIKAFSGVYFGPYYKVESRSGEMILWDGSELILEEGDYIYNSGLGFFENTILSDEGGSNNDEPDYDPIEGFSITNGDKLHIHGYTLVV